MSVRSVVILSLALLAVGLPPSVRAQTPMEMAQEIPVAAYTLDLTAGNMRALPVWLDPAIIKAEGTLPTVEVPVMPAPAGAQLGVTIYFDDQTSGFLRVFWNGQQSRSTLSANLLQGTTSLLSRTLLVPPECLNSPGRLVTQSSGPGIRVKRIRFEWLGYAEILAATQAPLPAIIRSEGQQPDDLEVKGEPYFPREDSWSMNVVTAPLSDRIEHLQAPTALAFHLEGIPTQARLSATVAVRDIRSGISIYVNGELAGSLAIASPSLTDPGWFQDETGRWRYAGWLDANLLLAPEMLVAGENLIEFTWTDTGSSVALKDPAIQLRFPSDLPPPPSSISATSEPSPELKDVAPDFTLTPPEITADLPESPSASQASSLIPTPSAARSLSEPILESASQ